MRALDRRLLQRARPIRVALGIDVALGLVATALLIAQAVIVATLVAAAFDGSVSGGAWPLLAALAAVVAVRAGLSGATETIGRGAAGRVMSDLRLALVRSRLGGPAGPRADDDVGSGEIATAAVAGVDALEVYLARYLPQVVLSVTVPVAVLATALVVDPPSAAILLVTLPVIPVFLALVGSTASERARERWTRWRSCPTTRSTSSAASPRCGPTTAPTPRPSSSPRARNGTGAARCTCCACRSCPARCSTWRRPGHRLVAVTVGVRLIGGGLTLREGLVVLLLTPELYAPLRTLGSLFHASSDGLAAAGRILDVLGTGSQAPAAGGVPGAGSRSRWPASRWSTRTAAGPCSARSTWSCAAARWSSDRTQRGRQEHGRGATPRSAPPGRRFASSSTARTSRRSISRPGVARSAGSPTADDVPRHGPREHRARNPRRRRSGCRPQPSWPGSGTSSRSCGAATTPSSGPAAAGSRPASSAASRWRERSSPNPRCWSSTSPSPPSTPSRQRRGQSDRQVAPVAPSNKMTRAEEDMQNPTYCWTARPGAIRAIVLATTAVDSGSREAKGSSRTSSAGSRSEGSRQRDAALFAGREPARRRAR